MRKDQMINASLINDQCIVKAKVLVLTPEDGLPKQIFRINHI